MCLASIDRARHSSTTKSKLATELTSKITSVPHFAFDTYIVDAMYMIRALDLKSLSANYGSMAEHILSHICIAPRVDFVFDTYRSSSIKEEEQEHRE